MSSTAEEHEALTLSQLLQTDGLPGVFCTPLRPWRDIADEALAHLVEGQKDARSPIYVRHGELVRIVRKEDGSPSIEALAEPALKDLLARSMNFVRMGTRGPMHIAPPDSIVKNLLSRSSWPFAALWRRSSNFLSSGLMACSLTDQATTRPRASIMHRHLDW